MTNLRLLHLSLAPVPLFLSGCRAPVPDNSGKWHGVAVLPNHQHSTMADVTLLLSQTEAAVHGDAALKMNDMKDPLHVPINTATIDSKGRVQWVGNGAQGFGNVYLSFDGTVSGEALKGQIGLTAPVILFGQETDSGPFTFTRV
jgi:hypothetical protein